MITIAGIRFEDEVVRTLEWAGCATEEAVYADLERVRRDESEQLLAECLEGCDVLGLRESEWRDYVSTLVAAA